MDIIFQTFCWASRLLIFIIMQQYNLDMLDAQVALWDYLKGWQCCCTVDEDISFNNSLSKEETEGKDG